MPVELTAPIAICSNENNTMRTLVLSLTLSVAAAVMGVSYAGAFGATVTGQTPSVSPIVATRDSTELLRTDFGTARILAGGDQTNNAFTVIEAVVEPGFEVAFHQHPFAESFYIVEGAMTVQVNGETRRVPEGSYVFVPGGTPHGFVNSEKAPLRNVVTTTPAALERMFRRRAEELRQQDHAAERRQATASSPR